MHRSAIFLLIILVGLITPACLKDMPESLPEGLVWDGSLAFPLGEDAFGLNIDSGLDSSLLEIDSLNGFPEWAARQTVIMEGLVEFDLSTLNSSHNYINEILMRINFYNDFPNEIDVQAYFIDPWRMPVDSLFHEGYIHLDAGEVAPDGSITRQAHIRRDARIGRERIDALSDASWILFRAVLANPQVDTSLIPYYPAFRFHVHLGAMIDMTVQY